jgi:hypothetical protein
MCVEIAIKVSTAREGRNGRDIRFSLFSSEMAASLILSWMDFYKCRLSIFVARKTKVVGSWIGSVAWLRSGNGTKSWLRGTKGQLQCRMIDRRRVESSGLQGALQPSRNQGNPQSPQGVFCSGAENQSCL